MHYKIKTIQRAYGQMILALMIMFALLAGLAGTLPAQAHFDPPAAHFAVWLNENRIGGFTWPMADGSQDWQEGESIDITVTVYEFEGGPQIYTDTQATYLVPSEHPSYVWESKVDFDLGEFTIQPGNFVVMSGAGVTKTHTVSNLFATTINANDDIIYGTSDPFQMVNVEGGCDEIECFFLDVPADGNGDWIADFGGVVDVKPGRCGIMLFREPGNPSEDGGDVTINYWESPYPTIRAWVEDDRIAADDWPVGTVVNLTVIDDGTTTHTDSGTMIVPDWNPEGSWVNFDLPFDLDEGDVISLTDADGLITKIHTVTALTVAPTINEVENTLGGTAEPGSTVELGIHDVSGHEFELIAGPEPDGYWVGDFDLDPAVPFDLVPGTGVVVGQRDDDDDLTWAERFVPFPKIEASITSDWIQGWEFYPEVELSIVINEFEGGPVITSFVRMTDPHGSFWIEPWEHGVDLMPGMQIIASIDGAGSSKDLVLADISLDQLDPENDIIAGTGPPDTMLWLDVGNEFDDHSQDVGTGGYGNWSVDLTGIFELTVDMWSQVRLFDDDGDATVAEPIHEEPPPDAYFSVIPNFQQVHGYHWPQGATLELVIDDPSNGEGVDFGPFYADVVEAPWDPGTATWVEFNLDINPNPVEMVTPGFIFTLTDPNSGLTKEHEVRPLFVNLVGPVTKTIGGTAEEGSEVRVDPNPGETDTSLTVIAEPGGLWTATNPDWDIHPYFGGDASQWDDDGDSTQFQIRIPLVTASPVNNWIRFEDFNHNTAVNIEVFRDSLSIFSDSRSTDNDGFAWLDGWEEGVDLNLEVGDLILATDQFSGLSKSLIVEPVKFIDIDLENDLFYGTAPGYRWMMAEVGNEFDGRGMDIESDAEGNWIADFGSLAPPDGPFDITWDMWPNTRLFDEDFDSSIAEPGPPFLHVVPYWPEVHGHDWDWDAFVTLTIDDDNDPSNGVLYEASKFVRDDPWCGEPCFDLLDILEIEPGMIVTMTDGETTRTVEVKELIITDVDPVADTVSGTAALGAIVQVDIHDIPECVFRFVEADSSGSWMADFSVPTDSEDQCQTNTWDLQTSSVGRAIITKIRHWDNGTLAYWPPPMKFVDAMINPNPVAVQQSVTINATFMGDVTSMAYLVEDFTIWAPLNPADGEFDTYSPETGTATFVAPDTPGIFPVVVSACDSRGDCLEVFIGFLVVYDPAGGFVTGGGWIWSPPGAYMADPDLEGKANFGFVSKYKKGASVPTGNTEFQFHAGDVNFHSSSYDWLVVTGSDYAMFKGTGTINGIGEYKFRIWAGDGDADTFRIKIWEEDEFGEETVIYNNGFDQIIEGGNIVVHTK